MDEERGAGGLPRAWPVVVTRLARHGVVHLQRVPRRDRQRALRYCL